MRTFTKTLLALVILAGILMLSIQVTHAAGVAEKPALYLTGNEQDCVDWGGTWVGPDDQDGTCTWPPGSYGHSTMFPGCADNQNRLVKFLTSVRTLSCENIPIDPGPPGPGYGKCGNEAGKTDEGVIVVTCQGVSVVFDAGSCTGKCTIGPKVLGTAKKGLSQLDGEVLGEAYVKLRNPGGGSYKICMPGEGTIYKWVSGAWVAQATQTVNGVSCAWSSGDGNYVLVAPSSD